MNPKIAQTETLIKSGEKLAILGDSSGAKKAAEIAYKNAVELFEAYEDNRLALDNTTMEMMEGWAERIGKLMS